jgi:quercetin dioxygenase-like cupin family protein
VYDIANLVDERSKVMNVVKRDQGRTTVTPAATMTTLASPTLGGTEGRSLWLVEMAAGVSGPLHLFDSEQIWTVLEGRVSIDVDGAPHVLEAGDTAVIPGQLERQVTSLTASRMLVTGDAGAVAAVPGEPEPRGTPAWIG